VYDSMILNVPEDEEDDREEDDREEDDREEDDREEDEEPLEIGCSCGHPHRWCSTSRSSDGVVRRVLILFYTYTFILLLVCSLEPSADPRTACIIPS
jgi:hypothetical protein